MRPDFDVIVVGAGGSGLAAACSAAEHGARVLVLEKRPQLGGTTGIAVGSFTAAGTRLQRAAGIDDSPRLHAEDAGKFAAAEIEARNSDPLREFFLSEAAATLDWLEGFGLTFVGPSPEPPNRVARMHNVVPGAKAYIAALQLALQRHGAVIVCNCTVESLLRDGDRVTGVRVRTSDETREYRACRGVILAAGDYANSPEMLAKFKGEAFRDVDGINPFATGDGHRLAESVGAALRNMDITYGPELRFVASRRKPFQQCLPVYGLPARVMGWCARRSPRWLMRMIVKRLLVTWQHPENALFDDGAILISRQGRRFVDETRWPDREIAVARQSGKFAYLLLDRSLVSRYSAWPHFISTAPDIAYAYVDDYLRLRPDVAIRSGDLADMASRRNVDAKELETTIENYNAAAASGKADEYGRDKASRHVLDTSDSVLLGPVKAYFTTTEGGAAINRNLQALDESGRPIPGLYAVGQNGLGGMILWGHGLHIAWAMTSGRLAGRAVMQGRAEQ